MGVGDKMWELGADKKGKFLPPSPIMSKMVPAPPRGCCCPPVRYSVLVLHRVLEQCYGNETQNWSDHMKLKFSAVFNYLETLIVQKKLHS